MFFYHYSDNNINDCINNSWFSLRYEYSFTSNYILVYYSSIKIYILSILLIDNIHIIWLSNYKLTKLQSHSFILILIFIISHYIRKKQIYLIETEILNYKAISLYIWIGFHIIQQRNNYYSEKEIDGLNFFYNKSQSKNLWRRLLILTI